MSASGIDIRGRSRKLRLNYRTTDEIRRWAVAILEGVAVDDLDDGLDSLKGYTSLFRGPEPVLVGYANPRKEMNGLIDWMKDLQIAGLLDADMGVLVRTRRQADQVMEAITEAGLTGLLLSNAAADDRKVPGVRVTTMHRSKGLEFAAVAIPFLADEFFPPKGMLKAAVDAADLREMMEREKSLLHVAATRAKKAGSPRWRRALAATRSRANESRGHPASQSRRVRLRPCCPPSARSGRCARTARVKCRGSASHVRSRRPGRAIAKPTTRTARPT